MAAPGPIGFVVAGVVYSAQTGLDYRKYKKGEISYGEFEKRAKRGIFETTGGMIGTTGGMVGGFFTGQMLIPFPVVGGIIGSVVGGMAGGITGASVSVKIYERMEAHLEARKEQAMNRHR